MPCKCVPARLISVFRSNKRPLGRPSTTTRHLSDINAIISNVDHAGTFNILTHITFDEPRWISLGEKLETNKKIGIIQMGKITFKVITQIRTYLFLGHLSLLLLSRLIVHFDRNYFLPIRSDYSCHFKTLGIAINSYVKEVNVTY